jgi:hypothetical protein
MRVPLQGSCGSRRWRQTIVCPGGVKRTCVADRFDTALPAGFALRESGEVD